jgi:hypothetical protein
MNDSDISTFLAYLYIYAVTCSESVRSTTHADMEQLIWHATGKALLVLDLNDALVYARELAKVASDFNLSFVGFYYHGIDTCSKTSLKNLLFGDTALVCDFFHRCLQFCANFTKLLQYVNNYAHANDDETRSLAKARMTVLLEGDDDLLMDLDDALAQVDLLMREKHWQHVHLQLLREYFRTISRAKPAK